MNKLITTLATFALALPLGASAATFEVVNPNEPMIVLPAFAELGASRLSTIEFCSEMVGKTYDQLITDSDFAGYELCLREQT